MSRFAVRSKRNSSLKFPIELSLRTPIEKLLLLVTVSLWIPWTLACGAAAQGATTNGNSSASSLSLPSVLPVVIAQQPYSAAITVKGGQGPYQFTVSRGALPTGLTLDPTTGVVSGTAKFSQGYIFEIQVTDQNPKDFGFAIYHLLVEPPRTGGPITITVSPTSASMSSRASQQFIAALQGTNNPGVQWSAASGSISASGVFVAPVVSAQTNVTITASSLADPSKQASAVVSVTPPIQSQQLSIETSSLPAAQAGQPYQATLSATGGTPPYTWHAQNSLPAGFSLSSSSGVFSGSTSTAGTYNFGVQVTDASSNTATQSLSVDVSTSTSSGNFDGPAELPRATMQSALSDTPAPGAVISVPAGGSLRTAIAGASCGDTIELQAGAVFDGQTVLPALACDDQHWIIIRTSAPDSALPPEGQRITPCYAGVASLPNRPAYPCSNPHNVMAQVTVSTLASTPIQFANGANHYRFIGLEITRAKQAGPIVALITPLPFSEADHIIVDRSWVHGTSGDDTRRGLSLSGVSYVAVINSYLNDFHCTAVVGTCADSQTLGGGAGDIATSVWQIQNNFLEASGENIMMGGSDATVVPTDITIQGNHFYKVPQWQQGSAGYVGGAGGHPFVVKNHIELKNAARILIEDNVFEYSWGGFSQAGYSIVLSPRNNYNLELKKANGCAVCAVTDITIRYNKISHIGAGFSIVNPLTAGEMAAASGRESIHDVVIDDINGKLYLGGGGLFIIANAWSKNVLNSISVRHITGFPDPKHSLMVFSNSKDNPEMWGFTFTDNLVTVPQFPVWSAGGFGTTNCAFGPTVPLFIITNCFKPYAFSTNVLAAPSAVYPPSKWPANNAFPATVDDVQMTDFNNGNGGNYELLPSSPYKNTASDGTDPGANISALQAALQGVY